MFWRARWLSGRASDSGARDPGFQHHDRRVVSLRSTLQALQSTGKYTGRSGSVQTGLKNCLLGR